MEAAQLKQDGHVKKVVVTGCLAQRYADELAGVRLLTALYSGVNSICWYYAQSCLEELLKVAANHLHYPLLAGEI